MKDALERLLYSRKRNDIKIEFTCPNCERLLAYRYLYTGEMKCLLGGSFIPFSYGMCLCGNEVRLMFQKSWAEVTGLSTQVIDNRISDWRKEAALKFPHIE